MLISYSNIIVCSCVELILYLFSELNFIEVLTVTGTRLIFKVQSRYHRLRFIQAKETAGRESGSLLFYKIEVYSLERFSGAASCEIG